jgi:hypothetical protein
MASSIPAALVCNDLRGVADDAPQEWQGVAIGNGWR